MIHPHSTHTSGDRAIAQLPARSLDRSLGVKENDVLVKVLAGSFFGRGGGKKSFYLVYVLLSFWGYSLLLLENEDKIMIGLNRVGGGPQ